MFKTQKVRSFKECWSFILEFQTHLRRAESKAHTACGCLLVHVPSNQSLSVWRSTAEPTVNNNNMWTFCPVPLRYISSSSSSHCCSCSLHMFCPSSFYLFYIRNIFTNLWHMLHQRTYSVNRSKSVGVVFTTEHVNFKKNVKWGENKLEMFKKNN